jgi:hypothetical protein
LINQAQHICQICDLIQFLILAEQVFEFHLSFLAEKHCQFFMEVLHMFQDFAFEQLSGLSMK